MKNLLLYAMLATVNCAWCQTDYVPGYLINNSGNRIECLIEDVQWKDTPTSFHYRLTPDGTTETENLMGTSEFGIPGKRVYKRFKVEMERSSTQAASLQSSRDPNWVTETHFLQLLAAGHANLYEFEDGPVHKFFFDADGKPLTQLVMIKFDDGSGVTENNLFRQQLFNGVRCEKTPDADFRVIDYSRKSLAAHFERYNSCFAQAGSANLVKAERDGPSFAFRVVAGAQLASISLDDPDQYYDASYSTTKAGFRIGLEAEYLLPFGRKNWSFFINPGYQQLTVSDRYSANVINPGFFNDGDPLNYSIEMTYNTVEIPIGIRHYFNLGSRSRIAVDASYVVAFVMDAKDIVLQDHDGLANASDTLPVSNHNNFAFGLGYHYAKWSAGLRVTTPRVISELPSWKTAYFTYGLLLGYQLF